MYETANNEFHVYRYWLSETTDPTILDAQMCSVEA